MKHDLAFIMRNGDKLSLFEAFLNELRILTSSDAPKGFDKFFKPPKSTTQEKPKEEKSANEQPSSESTTPPSKSSSSSPSSSKKPPSDWNLGMFSPSSGGGSKNQGSQGRPIGSEQNPDQNKMIFYGALGFAAFFGALTYFELGYKEISWRDFINTYVK